MEWDGGRRRICRLQGPAVPADHGRALCVGLQKFSEGLVTHHDDGNIVYGTMGKGSCPSKVSAIT